MIKVQTSFSIFCLAISFISSETVHAQATLPSQMTAPPLPGDLPQPTDLTTLAPVQNQEEVEEDVLATLKTKTNRGVELRLERHTRNHNDRNIDFGFGYAHSEWSRFSPSLKDGSIFFHVGSRRKFSESIELGLSFDFLSGLQSSTEASQNLYAMHVNAESRYYLGSGNVRVFAGMGLGFGGYRAWGLSVLTTDFVAYNIFESGALIALIPEAGFKIRLSPWSSVDIGLKYFGYLNNPNWRAGGYAAGIGLSFGR